VLVRQLLMGLISGLSGVSLLASGRMFSVDHTTARPEKPGLQKKSQQYQMCCRSFRSPCPHRQYAGIALDRCGCPSTTADMTQPLICRPRHAVPIRQRSCGVLYRAVTRADLVECRSV
jgi:hypothetical protein